MACINKSFTDQICNRASGQDLSDRFAKIALQPLAPRYHQPSRIQTQLMQYRRVYIGYIVTILDCVKTQFIGGSMSHAALDASTCHPDCKSVRVMVAPIAVL